MGTRGGAQASRAAKSTVSACEAQFVEAFIARDNVCALRTKPRFGLVVLSLHASHHVFNRSNRFDRANPLARAPNVLPGLGLGVAARTEVHLGRIAFGEVVGVHSGFLDRRAQIIAVHAGEEVRLDDSLG